MSVLIEARGVARSFVFGARLLARRRVIRR